jgi:hypothetical protein
MTAVFGEEPFVELPMPDPVRGMPHRITPVTSGVIWTGVRIADRIIVWRPTSNLLTSS